MEEQILRCQAELKWWSRSIFGNILKQLKEKRKQLKEAEEVAINGRSTDWFNKVKRELTGLLVKEELMWKQRSRALWLQEGDKNSKFFHSRATHRYRRNKIVEIKNSEGVVCSDKESISNTFIDYYQALFTSSQPNNLDAALDDIPRTITKQMNAWLEAEYTREEVEQALKQMEPLKAPGPDGLPLLFFQKYWQM